MRLCNGPWFAAASLVGLYCYSCAHAFLKSPKCAGDLTFLFGLCCGLYLAAPRHQTCAQGLILTHVQARGYQEEDSAGQTNVFAVEVWLTALSS